jgi:hypothetical protein
MTDCSIHKWSIYCQTEGKIVDGFSYDPIVVCPNNNTHTVNLPASDMGPEGSTVVKIKEEEVATGGHWQVKMLALENIPPGVNVFDYTWPYGISPLEINFQVSEDLLGDTLQVQMLPNTTVGNLTSDSFVGDTVLHVSPTVITNMKIGFEVTVTDGKTSDECGRCINVNAVDGTITVETALTHDYLAASPTYIKLTVVPVKYIKFGVVTRYDLGSSKIGASYLPANKIVRIIYTNNSGVNHNFYPCVEYLY